MKEITRIHIAKTPFEIEVTAKKSLEEYMRKLELYAEDQDWLEDIEIRITELLNERGIQQNGIISEADVTAVCSQLGEPKDFASVGDGDPAIGVSFDGDESRRLYRDVDGAVIAGVLSGIAKYFNLNPLWTRLGFMILLLLSFGTAAVVYLALWLAIPPAKTAAEKLQLAGKQVTLGSIKEFREQEMTDPRPNHLSKIIQGLLIYGTATLSVLAAIGALTATVIATIAIFTGSIAWLPLIGSETPISWMVWVACALFIGSGLLLSALFGLVSYALVKRNVTRQMTVAGISIVITGVIAFSAGIGTIAYVAWHEDARRAQSSFTQNVPLSDDYAGIERLEVNTGNVWSNATASPEDIIAMRIEYIVSNEKPRYELLLDDTTATLKPQLTLSSDRKAMTVTIDKTKFKKGSLFYFKEPVMRVYGPALQEITAKTGTVHYANKMTQDALSVKGEDGMLELEGAYKSVTIDNKNATLMLTGSSIEDLKAKIASGHIAAGVVRTLSIEQVDACSVDNMTARKEKLVVRAISAEKMLYNGEERAAQTIDGPCGSIIVGGDVLENNVPMKTYN